MLLTRRQVLKLGAVGLAGFAPIPLRAQTRAYSWTAAAGHGPTAQWVQVMREYFLPQSRQRIEALGYRVNWTEAYSGTLVKIGGEIDAMQRGVCDLSVVGSIWHQARLPLQLLTLYAPFSAVDVKNAVEGLDDLYATIPELNQAWQDFGMTYLAGIGAESLQIFTKHRIESPSELSGLKVGGAGPQLNWLRGTGAVGVRLVPATLYSDLKSGVYDAALTLPSLAIGLRLYEVTPYMLRVDAGATSWAGLTMRKAAFDPLPDPVKAAIRETAIGYRTQLIELQRTVPTVGFEELQAKGMTITPMSAANRRAWAASMPDVAAEWASDLEKKNLPARKLMRAYLASLRTRGEQPVRDWLA